MYALIQVPEGTLAERLAGRGGSYQECIVEVGLDQISLVDLPDIGSLHQLREQDRVVLMYLLWGDHWPLIARHEIEQPVAAFPAPDVLIQVVDATRLERDLELSLELSLLGRPMVIALNHLDEARADHRQALLRLRGQESVLDEAERKRRAAQRMAAIREKVSAEAARDAAPRPARPAPAMKVSAPRQKPASPSPARVAASAASVPDRSAEEARSRERFEKRQREAKAHRDEIGRAHV